MNSFYHDIEINSLAFSYKNVQLFSNLNLTFKADEITVIIGRSGVGKSTLFKLLMGYLNPQSGEILNCSHDMISYLSQEQDLLPWYTMKKNLEITACVTNTEFSKSLNLVEQFNLTKFLDKTIESLSGGQLKRFSLIRTFALNRNWILMDEPFSNLDYFTKLELYDFLRQLKMLNGKGVIMITHDIDEAIVLADTIIVLGDHKVTTIANNLKGLNIDMLASDSYLEIKKQIIENIC